MKSVHFLVCYLRRGLTYEDTITGMASMTLAVGVCFAMGDKKIFRCGDVDPATRPVSERYATCYRSKPTTVAT